MARILFDILQIKLGSDQQRCAKSSLTISAGSTNREKNGIAVKPAAGITSNAEFNIT
jgi:hypothetical protein